MGQVVETNTTVVNIKTGAYYDVFIGRGHISSLGNPFRIGKDGSRTEVVEMYRSYFQGRIRTDPEFKSTILGLRGKVLGCFCKPQPCHGDIIAEYLNGG